MRTMTKILLSLGTVCALGQGQAALADRCELSGAVGHHWTGLPDACDVAVPFDRSFAQSSRIAFMNAWSQSAYVFAFATA